MKNTRANRVEWVRRSFDRIESQGLTYAQIGQELQRYFKMAEPPSTPTVGRYLAQVREEKNPSHISEEALRLLIPENFPEWRKLLFDYDTSQTQHALFWCLRALSFKEDLPDWVIEYFELPPNINDDIVEKEKLLTIVLLVAPRHGKTMTMVHGLINLYSQSPDLRVIYCQGVATTTEDICGLIMLEMETNEKLVDLYGPFRGDDRQWSKRDGFVLAKRTKHSITPSFLPVGITSNVRSRDADILIIDDPQDITRAESEATTRKDYLKITTEFMTRREPHTPVFIVGSHLPTLFGDVFTQMEDTLDDLQTEGQAILMRKRPVHRIEECLVASGVEDKHVSCLEWPEFRDWNFLESQRVLLGDEMFLAVYQQENRIAGTRPFPPEYVKASLSEGGILDEQRSWKEILKSCPLDGHQLYTTLGFDPAAGESKKASYSALVVLQGCIQCQTLYLIDYWQRRQSPDLHASTIASFAKAFNPDYVRIEINAYQKALARDQELLEYSRKLKFHIDEWMTDDRKNTPEFGIPMLGKYIREQKVSMPHATTQDEFYAKELIDSLIRYPNKPNDLPMAFWLAAGMMWELWDWYQDLEPTYLPGRDLNVPQYMVDAPLRVNLQEWMDAMEYPGY